MATVPGGAQAGPVVKATTCDLCTSLSPNADPSCVYACPHDAAHRMNGRKLLAEVSKRSR
jgi:Fe-S-cluster-containing hydrogenase component 2